MKIRRTEIDFSKGVLITLMVIFHINYQGSLDTLWGSLTTAVYSFHMPGFLLLSGFLVNFNKSAGRFFGDALRKIVVPFLIFELLYVLLLSLAGSFGVETSNAADQMGFPSVVDRLLLRPIGPYWYLHTLFLCNALMFGCRVLLGGRSNAWFESLLLFSLLAFVLTFLVEGFRMGNVIYYILGVLLCNSARNYRSVVFGSLFSWIVLAVVVWFALPDLDRFSLAGVAATYLALSGCLALSDFGGKHGGLFAYLGRNSLAIVVFSPFFTAALKIIQPVMLKVDATGIAAIAVISVAAIAGSLGLSMLADRMGMSRWLFGNVNFYKPYRQKVS